MIKTGKVLLVLAAFALAGCVQDDRQPAAKHEQATAGGHVRVRGSDAMRGLAAALGADYSRAHRNTTVEVQGGGTAAGVTALSDGSADVAQASRRFTDQERQAIASARGAQVIETPVGYDVIALYVNAANPVVQLSTAQIAGILNGSINNWSAVGGPNAPIVLYAHAAAGGIGMYVGAGEARPKVYRDYADPRGAVAAVAADPNGIAYAAFVPATQARVVWIRRADNGQAVAPAEKTVTEQSYPLSSRLYFYTLSNAPAQVKAFVDWVRSPAAKKSFSESGYVQAK